jgi:maltose O-acetyltransferase
MTQIGTGVRVMIANHPRDPAPRRQMLEFGCPVSIGANVRIGSGAMLLRGVTIGDDAIIGAGSVVTRDVPRGVTAIGNPARVKGDK